MRDHRRTDEKSSGETRGLEETVTIPLTLFFQAGVDFAELQKTPRLLRAHRKARRPAKGQRCHSF